MAKRSLTVLTADELRSKRVLVRVDFNVPLDEAGAISDDTRIRAALPTINHLISNGAKVILAAHFGRPKGEVNEAMRLTPVAVRLTELLGKPVLKTESCIGPDAEAKVAAMPAKETAPACAIKFLRLIILKLQMPASKRPCLKWHPSALSLGLCSTNFCGHRLSFWKYWQAARP